MKQRPGGMPPHPSQVLARRGLVTSLTWLALVAAPTVAQAQFGDPGGEGTAATDTGQIGAAALSTPRYMGADHNRLRALPYLSYRWANGWFVDGINGVGYGGSPTPGLQMGVHVGVSPDREESDDPALRGMGNVNRGAELGGFAHQRLGSWLGGKLSLRSHLRYGSGEDRQGGQAELGLGWGTRLGERSLMNLGLAANWANQGYMQTYFGVTRAQSTSSGYTEHKTDGGLRDLRLSLVVIQLFSPTTVGLLMVSQTYWQGDAADSPLVQEKRNTMAVAALMYRF
ncbi:MipA/OmpV family protein [Hylemonella gracilis]|uniref:MipA/OmpV family protein n=1 Tax=Hylemonella gracilis TaxID=80880 RepID=UPI0013F161A4|nr:MipA/OmpV family protein [Hylemonella gracilis]